MRNGYPLVELHRHLDGNVRLETIIALGHQHGLPLPGSTVCRQVLASHGATSSRRVV